MNLNRRHANKIETTHFLLGLSSISICLSICCSAFEPITSITYIYIYIYIYMERERERERMKGRAT